MLVAVVASAAARTDDHEVPSDKEESELMDSAEHFAYPYYGRFGPFAHHFGFGAGLFGGT